MVEATDSIAIALREVTRRSGRLLWGDPSRLRSRLQYALGPVGDDEGSVLDAVVLAAMHEVPQALVHRGDLSAPTRALSDDVGPVLSARAVALWARAVADMGGRSQEEVAPQAANGVVEHRAIDRSIEHRAIETTFETALEDACEIEPDDAVEAPVYAPAGLLVAPPRKRRRPRWALLALGCLALLFIGMVGWVALGGDSTDVKGETETRTTVTNPAVPTLPVPALAATTLPATTLPATTLPATTVVASTAPTTAAPATVPAAVPGATAGRYVVVPRTRLLDTRGSTPRASATVAANAVPGFPAPAAVTAVILAVTVDAPSGPGSLRAVAAGAPAGQAAHLSFGSVPSAAGLVFAPLASDGRIDLRLTGATAHLVVDAVGYAASAPQAGGTSLVGLPAPEPLAPLSLPAGGTTELTLPAGASAALLSVVAQSSGAGAVTFYSGARPDTPSLVLDRGGATSAVVMAVGQGGRVSVHSTVAVQLAAFEVARFAPAPAPLAGSLSLVSADPVRATSGSCSDRTGKAISRISTVFPAARAFLLSISVGRAASAGVLNAYTTPAPLPGMADVAFEGGETRSAPAFVMVDGDRINLLCSGGLPDFVADIVAIFE